MNVTVVAFDNCMTSSVYALMDAFALAERLAAQTPAWRWREHNVRLATWNGLPVQGSGGFRIDPHCSVAAATPSDMVLVPAILGDIETVLQQERPLVAWLASLRAGNRVLASACTGAFLLAEAGLLEGRRITTNPMHRALFESRYPSVRLALNERMVVDQQVICAGSTSAVLDLAVHVIDRIAGHELAVAAAKALSINRNPGSQQPYLLFVARRDHGDERMLAVQDWIEERHAAAINVAQIAGAACMSVRNLNRRFRAATGQAPLDYLRAVRLETAKRLLELESAPVQQIALRVGYTDSRAFIRAFGAWSGLSPGEYRGRFRLC